MGTHLDRLPVEILHMIFQFMSNCDIIWSFHNVSTYLNAVLNSYCWSTLSFQSISKCRFDFICNHLEPRRVVCLSLSDDLKTPDQVQVFFHRFNLRDFVNLRSLTLLAVTNEDIYPVLSDLPQLQYLTSLLTSCRSSKPLRLGQTLNQLKSLQSLSMSHGDIFDHNVTFPLHTLKVLDAGACNFLELRRLQQIVPSLVSLKIILQANHQLQLLADVDVWSSLQRLNLTLTDEATTTFKEMEEFLFRFYNLTHLALNIRGSVDQLANGNRWETCPTIISLCKFDFVFEFDHPLTDANPAIDQIFNSFSTYFWRDFKKWYVAVTTHSVYTISCFDNQLFLSSTSPPLSTSSDRQWFYSKVKRIKLDKDISSINLHRFHNLERLDLPEEKILLSIRHLDRFIHLQHLIFQQPVSNAILGSILTQNAQINHLTLSQIDFNQLFPLETIHYLQLQETIKIINRTQIKVISRVFPSVQQLSIHLNSVQLICPVIDSFRRLQNGIFHFYKIIKPVTQEWLRNNTYLGDNNTCSFTYRNEPDRFIIWIGNSDTSSMRVREKRSESFSLIQESRSDKCSVQ